MELMEVEQVLSNLKSALSQLKEQIAKTEEARKATDLRNVEVNKIVTLHKEMEIDLAKREKAVSHIESIEAEIEKAKLEPEKLREILVEEHEFSQERFDSVMKKLVVSEEAKKQTGLGSFLK